MISLLVIASLVLPSVLGHCCLDDTISATIVEAGRYNPSYFLLNFKERKFILKPFNQTLVEFILNDINNGNMYTMLKNGVCTVSKLPLDPSTYDQCLRGMTLIDQSYLGPEGTMEVKTFGIEQKGVQSVISVTSDGCTPVVSLTRSVDGSLKTNFWLNVTTSVSDLSPLDVDIDNCVEIEEI